MMLKRYKNYSKRVKTDHWNQASSASVLSPRTAARASFASDEGLWVLRVRLDMGILGLIASEQGRNITP